MLGHREMNMEDYAGMLRRRIWWIVVPVVVTPLLALGLSFVLPNRYTSRTLILVEGQKVPENYIKPVLNDDLAARLATMQEQILSRTRLQPIIERFGLYKDDVNKVPMEDLVERMRKNITLAAVKPEFTGGRGGNLPGFFITFTADNPRIAQQVCAEITSMFMSENLKVREQSAAGTTEFLGKQLDDAKRKLDDLDSKLAAYKQKYLGRLPGQEQNNNTMLLTLNTQLDAVTQALDRAQQDKTYAESMLSEALAGWQSNDNSANPQTLEQQLSAAQAQLNALEARYTPDHPDVIKAKHEVAELRKKVEANASATPDPSANPDKKKSARGEPTNIKQLRTTIYGLDQAIKARQHQQAVLQEQIRQVQGKLAQAPLIEEEGKQLTRDYQTAQAFYNDLLAKKTQSEMATDMERRQQGENFRVMDPANLPEKPSFPDRTLFTAGGLVLGLGFGFGLALVMELRDKSLRTEEDIEFYLELPTLAMVPTVGAMPGSHNGNKKHWWQRKKKDPKPTKVPVAAKAGVGA